MTTPSPIVAQAGPADTASGGAPRRYARQPLGLPAGSVRALLTFMVLGLIWALMLIPDTSLSDVEFCCDLDRNVFYGEHTPEQVAEALRTSHWYELREWVAAGRPGEG